MSGKSLEAVKEPTVRTGDAFKAVTDWLPRSIWRYSAFTDQFLPRAASIPPPAVHPIFVLLTLPEPQVAIPHGGGAVTVEKLNSVSP